MNNIDDDVLKDINLLKSLEQKHYIDDGTVKLLDYQEPHAKLLIDMLNKNNTALDASDPGIGKTYIASYVCKVMNLMPIVITPKNVVNKWISVLDDFGVKYLMVVNYELISRGKYIFKRAKIRSPNLKIIKNDKRLKYEWNVEKNVIFIFDEVHRCKYLNTMNAKLLLAAKETGNKILMLSATVVEKPIEFAIFAYVLGFSNNLRVLMDWIKKLSAPAKTLHTLLYDKDNPTAARLSIEELGDKFPETQIIAETYTMKKSGEISEIYKKISEKVDQYKKAGEHNKFIIAKLQNEFRTIELLKVPTFVELTHDYLEDGFSVVIFVNYTDTLKILAEQLKTDVLIHGDQTAKERDDNIAKFQSDEARIIIANIKAGGVGISLHDVNGKYPRVALISPTQSATNLIQALGRIHRSGGKSKSLQRIIFASNTPEENISRMLFRKLANLSLLNEGDLESYYIDGLQKDEHIKIQNSISSVNEDLTIIIDEQMERIKYKNKIKAQKISEIFPYTIDTVSGVGAIYLVQGKGIFSDIEILLMGETHTLLNPCYTCDKNCIYVLDVVTYIGHCIRPDIIDFYIERHYNPGVKSKFPNSRDFDKKSRIDKLYDSYRHLLNEKYPLVEQLRMHAVDIRYSAMLDQSNDEQHRAFQVISMLSSTILGYNWNDIMTNMLKPDIKIKIDYKNHKAFIDNYKLFIDIIYDYLSEPENHKYIKDVLRGDPIIFNKFKITKQKVKFLASYDNSIDDFAEKLENEMMDIYKHHKLIFDHLMYIKDKIGAVNHIRDTEKFINKFLRSISYDPKIYAKDPYDKNHPELILLYIIGHYMDIYTLYRMLRKFDNKNQNNIIFYGGSAHAENMCKILVNTGYFKLIVKQNDIASADQPHDCKILEAVY